MQVPKTHGGGRFPPQARKEGWEPALVVEELAGEGLQARMVELVARGDLGLVS